MVEEEGEDPVLKGAHDRSANQQMWPATTVRDGEQMHERNIRQEIVNVKQLVDIEKGKGYIFSYAHQFAGALL